MAISIGDLAALGSAINHDAADLFTIGSSRPMATCPDPAKKAPAKKSAAPKGRRRNADARKPAPPAPKAKAVAPPVVTLKAVL